MLLLTLGQAMRMFRPAAFLRLGLPLMTDGRLIACLAYGLRSLKHTLLNPTLNTMKYQFYVYSPILGKTFHHTERFDSLSDFRLYCTSLWGGN